MEDNIIDLQRKVKVLNDENNKMYKEIKELKEDIGNYVNIVLHDRKEIERLNNIINESADEILKELEENHHLSYGVALAIRQKLIDYREYIELGLADEEEAEELLEILDKGE